MNQKGEGTYRLPSDEEWECACRAETTTHFATEVADGWMTSLYDPYWDPDAKSDAAMDVMGWYSWNTYNPDTEYSSDGVELVAQFQANPWGLYDMHGNVSEIVISERFKNNYPIIIVNGWLSIRSL